MSKKRRWSDAVVIEEAKVMVSPRGGSTFRVAEVTGVPPSTVNWHMIHRLGGLDLNLFHQVEVIRRTNLNR